MEQKTMRIRVSRHDDPETWNAIYTIVPDTPHTRREWNRIYNDCCDDTGMEPLLLHDGETDEYVIPADPNEKTIN